ncbi:MAG: hypothetical protein Q8Q73_09230 [Stagnimonas sp.]|nr:hypothetical protein [Stagnimonas sp.]
MRHRHGAAWALVALLAAPAAQALSLELKPSAHAELRNDDNIFRAPDQPGVGAAPKVSDTLSQYGAGARLTLRHSLQSVEFRGEYDHVDYADQDQLDHDRYRLAAEARLAYGANWGAELKAGRQRRLENFAYRDDTQPGFVRLDTASAELRYALTPRWTASARGDRYASRASLLSSRDYDLTETGAEVGGEYRRNGYSSLGLFLRQVEGEFPSRVVLPGDGREKDYRQRSLILRAGYTPSGLSDFAAQLGYTQRRHDVADVADFSGLTGRLGYTRRLSGRTRLKAEAYRDLYYVEEVNANYVENLGLSLSADWRYSAKLSFAAALQRVQSDYRGASGIAAAGEPRSDDLLSLSLGADYRPFYRFSVLPEYRHERRGSNALNSDYTYSTIGVDFLYQYGARLNY